MLRVVGVHGVGNYDPAQPAEEVMGRLSAAWASCLCRGCFPDGTAEVDLRVAYYAHHLHEVGRQGVGDRLEDLDPQAQLMVLEWLRELGLPEAQALGPGTLPLRQALGWLVKRRGLSRKTVERFVALFFREVATYLRDPQSRQRQAVRAAVADTVAAHAPQVLIAHSLGSVVAYETLWAHPDLRVDLLITIGSPLALPHAVFPHLAPSPQDGRGSRPPGVKSWINVADIGDLVAIPPRALPNYFSGIDADHESVIHAFDFHRVTNYLACPPLADALRTYIAGHSA